MIQLHSLKNEERELYFRTVANELNIPAEIIEKDFWVVWTLHHLFSLEELTDHLTFKGGTSLSKIYKVIERFSEDIDLSIEKDFSGFGEKKEPEKALSRKKRQAVLDDLKSACSRYVQTTMRDDLNSRIESALGTQSGWALSSDDDDPDKQTLLFEYPSNTQRSGYIRPIVRIEIGARSEHWPVSQHEITSYAKDHLKEKITEESGRIRVLNAERTFWEKATILHQYAHLPIDKGLPPRLSRHLYDFFCLLRSSIKTVAVEQDVLLERVATHKSIYFASTWASYQTARKGTLRLLPLQRVHGELERDYGLMEEMFFGTKPTWKEMLAVIGKFEREYNGVSLESKIIVNGRQKTWSDSQLSYNELVGLAFDNPPKGENVLFTITYRNGPYSNEDGTLTERHFVQVKDGMIFNVTATDKS